MKTPSASSHVVEAGNPHSGPSCLAVLSSDLGCHISQCLDISAIMRKRQAMALQTTSRIEWAWERVLRSPSTKGCKSSVIDSAIGS